MVPHLSGARIKDMFKKGIIGHRGSAAVFFTVKRDREREVWAREGNRDG